LPKEYLAEGQKICNDFFNNDRIHVTVGGSTRFHSVQNGLQLIKEESIVFVHDGVRCLLSTELVYRCYQTALESGSAIPVIDSKDSVRILRDEKNEPIDRESIKLVQTPQTFKSAVLLSAFDTEFKSNFTDEATVVEHSGVKVTLVPGEENNIKITKPFDLLIAEKILESK
jgi:2-C-methyl-D-erythritol 4-phosphate cytidylyltransferase